MMALLLCRQCFTCHDVLHGALLHALHDLLHVNDAPVQHVHDGPLHDDCLLHGV